MKALKSPLAKKVLADPNGLAQLRRFFTADTSRQDAAPVVIEITDETTQRTLRLTPVYVPRAS
jgi:hypothetical protein